MDNQAEQHKKFSRAVRLGQGPNARLLAPMEAARREIGARRGKLKWVRKAAFGSVDLQGAVHKAQKS